LALCIEHNKAQLFVTTRLALDRLKQPSLLVGLHVEVKYIYLTT